MIRRSSPWLDRFPRTRRPSFPALRGTHESRVAIVGGGMTGVACALTLATSGIQTVLLEAETLGHGMSSGSAGVLREGFAGRFQDAAALHGLRTARALWDGLRRGSLDFAAALRRHRISCGLEPVDVISFAPRTAESARALQREYGARRDAGIEGSWMSPAAMSREAAVESSGGIRTRGFTFDPYRALTGMVKAAGQRGAAFHERSEVRRIRTTKRGVEIITAGGSVAASSVVVATAAPIHDLRALRRHLRAGHVYGVLTEPLSAAMRRRVGQRRAVLEDATGGHRFIRWMPEHSVLVSGGRQPAVPERLRERAIVQRTGQLMYELLLLYPEISGLQPLMAWDRLDYETGDGLPLIGPHRNFPRHFFAFAGSRHGAGSAWAAARMALRYVVGEPARGDAAFALPRSS